MTGNPPPLPYGPAVYMERQRRGWSRQDLSDRLSQVGVTSVWRLETGSALPTVRTLEAFARAFGIRTSELVRLAEEFRDRGPAKLTEPVVDAPVPGQKSYERVTSPAAEESA